MGKKTEPARRPSDEEADEATQKRLARAQLLLSVKIAGTDVEFTLPPIENLPVGFRREIKQLAGKGLADLGVDLLHQYCCMWWASRRLAGERNLSLEDCEADWDERCMGVRLSDIDTEWIGGTDPLEDEDPSPEA